MNAYQHTIKPQQQKTYTRESESICVQSRCAACWNRLTIAWELIREMFMIPEQCQRPVCNKGEHLYFGRFGHRNRMRAPCCVFAFKIRVRYNVRAVIFPVHVTGGTWPFVCYPNAIQIRRDRISLYLYAKRLNPFVSNERHKATHKTRSRVLAPNTYRQIDIINTPKNGVCVNIYIPWKLISLLGWMIWPRNGRNTNGIFSAVEPLTKGASVHSILCIFCCWVLSSWFV